MVSNFRLEVTFHLFSSIMVFHMRHMSDTTSNNSKVLLGRTVDSLGPNLTTPSEWNIVNGSGIN